MFSSGELILIGLVALIVIGPERLPRVARTAGHMLGRLQRYVGDIKADISREMQLEDLKKLQQQTADQVRSMEASVNEHMKSVETSLNDSIAQGIGEKSETGSASPTGPFEPGAAGSPPLPTAAESEKPKA